MKKKKFAVGSFENIKTNIISAVGFEFKTEKQLQKKLKRAESYGWLYDPALIPLKEIEFMPNYIEIKF